VWPAAVADTPPRRRPREARRRPPLREDPQAAPRRFSWQL